MRNLRIAVSWLCGVLMLAAGALPAQEKAERAELMKKLDRALVLLERDDLTAGAQKELRVLIGSLRDELADAEAKAKAEGDEEKEKINAENFVRWNNLREWQWHKNADPEDEDGKRRAMTLNEWFERAKEARSPEADEARLRWTELQDVFEQQKQAEYLETDVVRKAMLDAFRKNLDSGAYNKAVAEWLTRAQEKADDTRPIREAAVKALLEAGEDDLLRLDRQRLRDILEAGDKRGAADELRALEEDLTVDPQNVERLRSFWRRYSELEGDGDALRKTYDLLRTQATDLETDRAAEPARRYLWLDTDRDAAAKIEDVYDNALKVYLKARNDAGKPEKSRYDRTSTDLELRWRPGTDERDLGELVRTLRDEMREIRALIEEIRVKTREAKKADSGGR